MGPRLAGNLSAAAALLASALAAAPAAAAPVSLRGFAAQQMKLEQIGYRMAVASAGMCSKPKMLTGMLLHDLSQYDFATRPAVARAFSLTDGIGLIQIIPGSAADRAGLRVDDEIVALGGTSVLDSGAAIQREKSYARVQKIKNLLETSLHYGTVDLLVRRSGALIRVQLAGEAGCGGGLSLIDSRQSNAWSDGDHVIVTTGISRLAKSDDELAFVVAHEMAHNILGHASSAAPAPFGFSLNVGKARKSELAADQLAVALMRAGGYRPAAGISFLQTVSRRYWWAFSLDHPSFGRRIRAVNAAIAAVPAHQADPALGAAPGSRQVVPQMSVGAQVAALAPVALRQFNVADSEASQSRSD